MKKGFRYELELGGVEVQRRPLARMQVHALRRVTTMDAYLDAFRDSYAAAALAHSRTHFILLFTALDNFAVRPLERLTGQGLDWGLGLRTPIWRAWPPTGRCVTRGRAWRWSSSTSASAASLFHLSLKSGKE